ncbi:conjugal transfer mating pair stabilization protein TraG [Alphaproteobacteria bacterium]
MRSTGILDGREVYSDDLHRSNDIWALVRDNGNPINGFSYRDPTTKVTNILSCKDGAQKLDKGLTKNVNQLSSVLGRRFMLNATASTSDMIYTIFFKEKLASSYNFMSGIAAQAEDILKQEMMINTLEDVKNNYAVSKATVQQRAWYLVTGELASNFLVAMKVVLETLAYSSFIFVVMLVMLPSGITILARYFGVLLWLQLWAPLYAVLNLVMSIILLLDTKARQS